MAQLDGGRRSVWLFRPRLQRYQVTVGRCSSATARQIGSTPKCRRRPAAKSASIAWPAWGPARPAPPRRARRYGSPAGPDPRGPAARRSGASGCTPRRCMPLRPGLTATGSSASIDQNVSVCRQETMYAVPAGIPRGGGSDHPGWPTVLLALVVSIFRLLFDATVTRHPSGTSRPVSLGRPAPTARH